MSKVTFISGNEFKVRLLTDYMKLPIEHLDIDLDEIQSLDLKEIVKHKVKQAYELVNKPVMVEDIGLEIKSLGRLPGPLIKWFLKELGAEGICTMVSNFEDRSALATVCYGYYDGVKFELFYGEIEGTIPLNPRGEGHGWNPIFIPNGESKTYAEMDDEWFGQYGIRAATVYPKIKQFLAELDKKYA